MWLRSVVPSAVPILGADYTLSAVIFRCQLSPLSPGLLLSNSLTAAASGNRHFKLLCPVKTFHSSVHVWRFSIHKTNCYKFKNISYCFFPFVLNIFYCGSMAFLLKHELLKLFILRIKWDIFINNRIIYIHEDIKVQCLTRSKIKLKFIHRSFIENLP